MEPPHEEQYSQEINLRAYMSLRDYRNLPWQQHIERNPNPCRSMREYRDQWTSTPPSYSVTPTYAPPPHPQYASLSQPQPPQLISPVEQAILDLTKLVGDVVKGQKKFNSQLSQRICTMESSLNKRLDVLQSDLEKKIDIMQHSISRLTIQHGHQEEENLEGEWLTGQEKLMQKLVEAPEELPTGEAGGGRGKEAREEPQEPILQPIPMNLNPIATSQPKNSPLPVYILPTPATNSKPVVPAPKAHVSPSLLVQNIRKLVATIRAFATTSKTQEATHIAWHIGWFGCWFGFRAPEPRYF